MTSRRPEAVVDVRVFHTPFRAALLACALATAACGPADSRQVSSSVFTTARPTVSQAARDFFGIRPKAIQPIEFPHKKHIEKGLTCTDYCHESVTKGPVAGLPGVKTCMICHDAIATDRPLVQQVANYQKNGLDIPWQRVYGYTREAHVRFNHAPHIRANVDCSTCHGSIAQQTVAERNVDLTMGFCVNCHKQKNASNDCLTCHF
jgi:Cytochrome c7 and related cytochrome c